MQTWVETFSIKAGMFGWAIPISNTARFFNDRFRDWCACYSIRVSSIVRNAGAVSSVIACITIGIPGALAWVNTLLILASLCVWAIWVPKALIRSAIVVGVPQVVLYA